ncbi:Uncharacterised protein [Kytococcus sedentarius]|nr:Uncharacterised protein [Kytococcus sedentarius]
MRSRYSAFARGDSEHLWRTWHPRTRPASVDLGDAEWTGLEVHEVVGGRPGQTEGVVEFTARSRQPDGSCEALRERSRFAVRAGRWFYVDGEQR